MSFQKQLEKMGATPGKLALIGVLVLVLGMVIVKQLPKGTPSGASPSLATASLERSKTEKAGPTKQATSETQATETNAKSKLAPWPELGLKETLTSNPFALPSWAVPKEKSVARTETHEESEELAELLSQGTSIVVIGQGKKSATIGEQKLYVGDILEGYQVTDITTQGVVLNKLRTQ